MNNCFVTKITDSIPNDATHNPMLHKLDEKVFHFKALATGNQRFMVIDNIRQLHGQTDTIVKTLLGDVTFAGSGQKIDTGGTSEHRFAGTSNNINVNSLSDFYLKVRDVEDVKRIIFNTINVATFDLKDFSEFVNCEVFNSFMCQITGDIKSLATMTNLTILALPKCQVTGDIKSLATMTNLTKLNLSGSQVTGDIKSLATMTNLTSFDCQGTSIGGELKNLCDPIAKAKVAHTLNVFFTPNNKITYNGNYDTNRIYVVTFKEDGTYTVENVANV